MLNQTGNQVVLVDEHGKQVGVAEKLAAHEAGQLHLAFSVMIYRETEQGAEYLLQKRAMDKYHSGGLWTNTCCSHPGVNETIESAAKRRLYEELGIDAPLPLALGERFIYRAELDNQLVEHELDQIVLCRVDEVSVYPNPEEVMDYRWWRSEDIARARMEDPAQFTAWFGDVMDRINPSLA